MVEAVSPTPPAPPMIPADLPAEAAAEWDEAIPTGMEQPAYATTRSLLIEMRRQTSAIGKMTRAISWFGVIAGLLLLVALGTILVVVAALYAS